jgi:hypothetical protein
MAKAIDGGRTPISIFTTNTGEGDYQPLENNPAITYIQTPESKKVEYKYSIKPENCYKLDENLKLITDELALETKKLLTGGANREYIKALQSRKSSYEGSFTQADCRNKIEEDRLKESANLLTKTAIGQEKDVVDKSFNLQKVYIGVGALVLVVGLYIVLKK